MEPATTAMENLAQVVSTCMTNLGNVATAIGNNQLLLLGVGVWFTGSAIGLAKRLIGRG